MKTTEEDDCEVYPCNQQKWKQRKVEEAEKDEEEKDEEHHIPDTLERQLEKLMDEGEKLLRTSKKRTRKRRSQRF